MSQAIRVTNMFVEIDGERIEIEPKGFSLDAARAVERFDMTEAQDLKLLTCGSACCGSFEVEDPESFLDVVRRTLQGYPFDDYRSRAWCCCDVEEVDGELREVRPDDCICCNARDRSRDRAALELELLEIAFAGSSSLERLTARSTLESMGKWPE